MAGPGIGHLAGAAAVAAVLLMGTASGAAAAGEELFPVPETGAAGLLSLSSSMYPLVLPPLEAGESFSWQVGVSLDQPRGEATLQVTAGGEIAGTDTYLVAVDECDVPWQGSSGLGTALECPTGATARITPVTLAAHRQDVLVPLNDLREGNGPYLRFILSRPAGSQEPVGSALTLGIGVTAAANDDGAPPGQRPAVPLADTGAAVLQGLFAAGGLLLLGAAALAAVRRTQGRTGGTP